MPQLRIESSFLINTTLCISPSEIRELYLSGIKLTSAAGIPITDEQIIHFIEVAQQDLQNELSIKLIRQVFSEQKTFHREEFRKLGLIKASHPIVKALLLEAKIGDSKVGEFTAQDLTTKAPSDEHIYSRNLFIIPYNTRFIYSTHGGLFAHFFNYTQIPAYWHLNYITGWKKIPKPIVDFIGKMVAANILSILNDNFFSTPGVASSSISIDGLSQSISTINSAAGGVYGARIKQYAAELLDSYKKFKGLYKAINFITL